MESQYAKAGGVDPLKIASFKDLMAEVGERTRDLALKRRNVKIFQVLNPHGGIWQYAGPRQGQPIWNGTDENLGHLSFIAEAMYRKTGKSYHDRVARAAGLIIAVDVIAHGGMPFVWLDMVQASSSEWFNDEARGRDYAQGCLDLCEEIGCSLAGGESAAMRYGVRPPGELALEGALFSGFMGGIIPPERPLIIAGGRRPGQRILGVPSSGVHTNGSSLLIAKVLAAPPRLVHGRDRAGPHIRRRSAHADAILCPARRSAPR